MVQISEIHDCDKCHNKIVCIEIDLFGNTFCGYCHERVDYSKLHEEFLKQFNEFKMRERCS